MWLKFISLCTGKEKWNKVAYLFSSKSYVRIPCDLLRFHCIIRLFGKSNLLSFQMCFIRRTIAYLCLNMINFDAVDFSEHCSEEVISFFWRSVYIWVILEFITSNAFPVNLWACSISSQSYYVLYCFLILCQLFFINHCMWMYCHDCVLC